MDISWQAFWIASSLLIALLPYCFDAWLATSLVLVFSVLGRLIGFISFKLDLIFLKEKLDLRLAFYFALSVWAALTFAFFEKYCT